MFELKTYHILYSIPSFLRKNYFLSLVFVFMILIVTLWQSYYVRIRIEVHGLQIVTKVASMCQWCEVQKLNYSSLVLILKHRYSLPSGPEGRWFDSLGKNKFERSVNGASVYSRKDLYIDLRCCVMSPLYPSWKIFSFHHCLISREMFTVSCQASHCCAGYETSNPETLITRNIKSRNVEDTKHRIPKRRGHKTKHYNCTAWAHWHKLSHNGRSHRWALALFSHYCADSG